jgi:hypothetical protein
MQHIGRFMRSQPEASRIVGMREGPARFVLPAGPGAARRRVVACLVAAFVAALSSPGAHADVVPPEALAVGEGWLALVDAGRTKDALARYVDAANRKSVGDQLAGLTATKTASREIEAWRGHGPGDVSRVLPGSYFSLIFVTIEGTGATRHDEVRVVPHDGTWRVIGYLRSTP